MDGEYEFIRESSVAEVLRYFISMEAEKYADKREEMLKWLSLHDRKLIRKIRKFEKKRDDDNPTLGWTIGTRANSNYLKISRWIFTDIRLVDLYSCGINSDMKDDLDSVKGNLKHFVDAGYPRKYPEFRLESVPPEGEARIFVGIARSDPNRDGSIELIDGSHRAVAMLANSITSTNAHIGIKR